MFSCRTKARARPENTGKMKATAIQITVFLMALKNKGSLMIFSKLDNPINLYAAEKPFQLVKLKKKELDRGMRTIPK